MMETLSGAYVYVPHTTVILMLSMSLFSLQRFDECADLITKWR